MADVDGARVPVLASHDEGRLERVCTTVVELDGGRVRCTGQPAAVLGKWDSEGDGHG